jgi:hypothetical protein
LSTTPSGREIEKLESFKKEVLEKYEIVKVSEKNLDSEYFDVVHYLVQLYDLRERKRLMQIFHVLSY